MLSGDLKSSKEVVCQLQEEPAAPQLCSEQVPSPLGERERVRGSSNLVRRRGSQPRSVLRGFCSRRLSAEGGCAYRA